MSQYPDKELKERFFKVPLIHDGPSYVLGNYHFWAEHEDELTEWLEQNTAKGSRTQKGMILEFTDEKEEVAFLLKWSS